MSLNYKIYIGIITILSLVIVYLSIPNSQSQSQIRSSENAKAEILVTDEMQKQSLVLLQDLQKYKHLDFPTKSKISILVPKYAKKYALDYSILYSVLWKETRFIHTTQHNPTYIKSLKTTVEAIGIGGIVCEFWCEKLKNAKIISQKEDLFYIENGIEASAFVLSELRKLGKQKGYTLDQSMLNRYYGKPTQKYYKPILAKASQVHKIFPQEKFVID